MGVSSWMWMLLILFDEIVVTENLRPRNCGLSVSFRAVSDTEDLHGTAAKAKQNAIVSEAQTKGTGHLAVQSGNVTRSGAGKTQNAIENARSSIAVNGA